MRFLAATRRSSAERLLWSRDSRFVKRLSGSIPDARVLELDSGSVLVASAESLTDALALRIAAEVHDPDFGLIAVDAGLPERDRYLFGLSAAVQASGLAERIGMSQSPIAIQARLLDYFFTMRSRHEIAFQPIVDLATGVAHEYECLLRPVMPTVQQTTGTVIQAAVDTGRSVELDTYVIDRLLALAHPFAVAGANGGRPPLRLAVNLTPASLLDERFSAPILAARVRESGYDPRQLTIECTEQQAVSDVAPLKRQVKALRSLGFGVAVDDAGAGYASFSLIAALRPSIIKIDREIVSGIARDDAKQALVEAFVSFGRRIGARLVAEGIERRADLAVLTALRVDLGQGYLLGRPAERPLPPRRIERLRIDGAREAIARRAIRAAEVLAGPD